MFYCTGPSLLQKNPFFTAVKSFKVQVPQNVIQGLNKKSKLIKKTWTVDRKRADGSKSF
jgi:hypothetical protein